MFSSPSPSFASDEAQSDIFVPETPNTPDDDDDDNDDKDRENEDHAPSASSSSSSRSSSPPPFSLHSSSRRVLPFQAQEQVAASSTGPTHYVVSPELAASLFGAYHDLEDGLQNGEEGRRATSDAASELHLALQEMRGRPVFSDRHNKVVLGARRGVLSFHTPQGHRLPRLPLEIHRRIAELGSDVCPPEIVSQKGHLFTAALVCREWKDFALPLLYSVMDLEDLFLSKERRKKRIVWGYEQYGYAEDLSTFGRRLARSGNATFVRTVHHPEAMASNSFFDESRPLPNLTNIEVLRFASRWTSYPDLSVVAPSLRVLAIALPFNNLTSPVYFPLILPATLETLTLYGLHRAWTTASTRCLSNALGHQPHLSTLHLSSTDFGDPYLTSDYLHLSATTLGSLNSLWTSVTHLSLSRLSLNESFLSSLSSAFPALTSLSLSLTDVTLPSKPILVHSSLHILTIHDPEDRGLKAALRWISFVHMPSANLLLVPQLRKIRLVPEMEFETEPDLKGSGRTFETLRIMAKMGVTVTDSTGREWDADWVREKVREREKEKEEED